MRKTFRVAHDGTRRKAVSMSYKQERRIVGSGQRVDFSAARSKILQAFQKKYPNEAWLEKGVLFSDMTGIGFMEGPPHPGPYHEEKRDD